MLQVQVIGNLGADAEVKEINGKQYSAFRVAATSRNETTWVSILYSYRENLHKYLIKGQQVFVQGEGRVKLYTSKNSEKTSLDFSVLADKLQLCGSKADKAVEQSPIQAQRMPPQAQPQQAFKDDLPFS